MFEKYFPASLQERSLIILNGELVLPEDRTKPQLEIIILAEFPVGPWGGDGGGSLWNTCANLGRLCVYNKHKAGLSAARRILAPEVVTPTLLPRVANRCVSVGGGRRWEGREWKAGVQSRILGESWDAQAEAIINTSINSTR